MKDFAEASALEWRWVRPRVLQRRWHLMAGDDAIAQMESASAWRTTMVAETAGARWRLRHRGFLLGSVRLEREVAAGEFATAATFRAAWFGAGRFESGDDVLRWRRDDFLGRRWTIGTEAGAPLVTFERLPGLFRAGCRVLRSDAARTRSDLPQLSLLGWYVLLLMVRQVQAAT